MLKFFEAISGDKEHAERVFFRHRYDGVTPETAEAIIKELRDAPHPMPPDPPPQPEP